MQTPIMLGHPWLALDGILAHLVNRELRGEDYYVLPSKEPISPTRWYSGALLPLAQTRDVFHGSVAWLDCSEASVATIYKRFAEQQCHIIATDRRAIDIARGHFKAYAMRLPYVPARTATFFARGNLHETLRLLGYLPGLGKKVAYGYGMIKSVSVDETPEDWSLVKDGVAMRPLPEFLADSSEKMMLAYKMPYWDKRNVAPCVPPGSNITWMKEPLKAS
jgi:hypothetical protein